jgi:hypothetical protein
MLIKYRYLLDPIQIRDTHSIFFVQNPWTSSGGIEHMGDEASAIYMIVLFGPSAYMNWRTMSFLALFSGIFHLLVLHLDNVSLFPFIHIDVDSNSWNWPVLIELYRGLVLKHLFS